MTGKEVYILYGSQTGNSEDIAKDLHEKCIKGNISSVCKNLNSVKKVDLKDLAKFIIVVCSTTGNGDTPENADGWWRSIKLRATPKDTFADIPFAVMGLGDTNYDQFCHMGKMIDKRLKELGGSRLHPLCCADEATGLEETVEGWKAEIMVLLGKLDQLLAASASSAASVVVEKTVPEVVVAVVETPIIICDPPIVAKDWVPSGVVGIFGVSDRLELTQQIISPPDSALLPNSMKVLSNGPIAVINAGSIDVVDTTFVKPADGWTAESPFYASIKSAKWLTATENIKEDITQWGETKRVLHLEFNLSGSEMEYLPGDSVGICCPNPSSLVDSVFLRLKDAHAASLLSLDSSVSIAAHGVEEKNTLKEILTYKIDLVGVPRKTHVLALAEFCSDKKEEAALQWLCSKGDVGKQLWGQFIEAQRIGLGELLGLFPSCRPTLSALLACAGTMPPRFYSIASSPLKVKDSATVAFSCVRYTCGLAPSATSLVKSAVLKRSGLCTSYLEIILTPLLEGKGAVEEKVRLFLKSSITFKLPGSISPPLILIGPGTGVAPFMGFLQHRAMIEKEKKKEGGEITTGTWRGGFELEGDDLPHECNNVGRFIHSNPAGSITLFFGCRDHTDYLYKDEMASSLKEGTLTGLEVAQSRVGSEKVYVTHKLREKSAEIARAIVHDGGYIYICGDGNNMAKDVYAAIKDILKSESNMSDEEAEQTLDDLKLRRRYILDIWS